MPTPQTQRHTAGTAAAALAGSVIQRYGKHRHQGGGKFGLQNMLQKGKGLVNNLQGKVTGAENALENNANSFVNSIGTRTSGFVKGVKKRILPDSYTEAVPGKEGQPNAPTKSDGDLTGPFYPRNWSGDHLDSPEKALGQQRAVVFVNGVRYTLEKHYTAGQDLADELNVVIVGVWNATAEGKPKVGSKTASKWLGAAYDFAQSMGDKLNDSSHNPATATMVELIKKYGDASQPYGGLRILAHSQGSIIVSEALRQAQKAGADISKNDVSTFGNAIYTTPESGKYHHYVSPKDAVSNSVGSRGFGSKAIQKMLHWTQGLRPASQDEIELPGNTAPTGGRQHTLDKNVDATEKNDPYSDYIHTAGPMIRKQWAADPTWGYQDTGAAPETGAPEKHSALGTRHGPLAGGRKGGKAAALRDHLVGQEGAGKSPDEGLQKHLGEFVDFDPKQARMHAGTASAKAAHKMKAEAFTIGRDIFFGANKLDQHSGKGMGLIAHEMEHVGQQIGAKTHDAAAHLEHRAQHTAHKALAHFGHHGKGHAGGEGLDGFSPSDLAGAITRHGPMPGQFKHASGPAGTVGNRVQSLLNQAEHALRPALEFALALPAPRTSMASTVPSQMASEGRGSGGGRPTDSSDGSGDLSDMDARAVTERVYQLMKEEIRAGKARGLYVKRGR